MAQRKDFNGPQPTIADNPVDHEILSHIKHRLNIRIGVDSDADLAKIVEGRLPLRAITALVEHGLQEKEIYSLVRFHQPWFPTPTITC